MSRKLISVISGLLILVIAYFLSSLIISSDEEIYNNNTNITYSIRTLEVKNNSNPISVKVNGNLKSKYHIDLFSEVQGRLEKSEKEFKAGQNYRKSEVLLKIDSNEFLANVETVKKSTSKFSCICITRYQT